MLFNSIDFAFFLPLVFAIYWLVGSQRIKGQNLVLLLSSYVFYGWWDYRFLGLIVLSTIVDYGVGIGIEGTSSQGKKRLFLWLSLIFNLGLLMFFKYYNFFLDNISEAFTFFGSSISSERLEIVLPVGISFYTFQTLSYSIDVYRGQLKATNSLLEFASFVSFFPQLVAGPIERATNLLPQFQRIRQFDYSKAVDGCRQILWGLFKKVVIADSCAHYANEIFGSYQEMNGLTLFIGAILFTFQIYGDFSGYSDIAIGTARLFGFDLMKNFAFPYFSRDIAEFWRRWHISLSTWFRDYLYIPLGGSKGGTAMKVRNTFIIFLVSGFWHGANWTFIVWGGLNALYFLPLLLRNKNRRNMEIVAENRSLPSGKELFQMGVTFLMAVLAWVFFRSTNVTEALTILMKIFTDFFSMPQVFPKSVFALIFIFILVEWMGRKQEFGFQVIQSIKSKKLRLASYYMIVLFVLYNAVSEVDFIYFQF